MGIGSNHLRTYIVFFAFAMLVAGCTKVGPDYVRPETAVSQTWLEAGDKRIKTEPAEYRNWWKAFKDPTLDSLIDSAYRENLTLRIAGARVLEARAQLGATIGNLFPQTQQATGSVLKERESAGTPISGTGISAPRFGGISLWESQVGLTANWEIDFWGKRAGELTYIYYPFSDDHVNLYDRARDRILSLYTPADEGAPQAKRLYISFADKYDIDRYELDLSYSPSDSYLSGKARISVVPRTDDLDTLTFRFNPDLEILKVQDQEKRELFYTLDKLRKYLYVYLISPPGRQQSTWIEVYYRGHMSPLVPATDVIGQAVSREKLVFRPRFETYLFSQAGFWYPAPPDEDYFVARLKLLIPPEYKCVAVGDLVEKGHWNEMGDVVEIEKSGSSVYTFETREPIKYMAFIVGKFEHPKDVQDPVPIQTYVSTEINENDPAIVEQAKSILEYYIRSFGPFPFEKLGIVRRLFPTAGGHSPASFIVLNQVPWRADSPYPVTSDNPVNLSDWDEYFMAHEIAHQWWGQGVSFDTYRDQWLSEGLAQFAAASYLRNRYGEKAFGLILKKFSQWTEKKSIKGPIALGSRLSFFDFDAFQAIVYDKAALVMFMLQDVLGRDVFFAGLREFFAKYKYGAARTEDFIAVMERASGRDLQNFFQGWFRSYELPDVQTSWSEEVAASGTRLKVRVTQAKGLFVFPLWIEWTSRGQSRSAMAVIDKVSQEIVLEVPGKVDRVRINPTRVVPGKFS